MADKTQPTRFVAVLFKPGARTQAECIKADRWLDDSGVVRLYRDDRLVWRGLLSEISELAAYTDQRPCRERCREHRETMAGAGAATVHLQESGVAPRRRRGGRRAGPTAIPAEGIRVIMED